MKKTTKRLLAAVLCLVMVLGALPLTALAEEVKGGTAAANVVYGSYDESNVWSQNDSNGTWTSTDGNIKLSKTAEPADNPNEYTVTLQVELKKREETAAAATVLTFDRSGSMNWCAECGKEYCNHAGDTVYQEVYTNDYKFHEEFYIIAQGAEEEYAQVYHCSGYHGRNTCDGGEGWYYSDSMNAHTAANKITPKANASSDGTQLYKKVTLSRRSKLDAAKDAAKLFLKTYSALEFNENGTVKTGQTSRNLKRYVSVVSFARTSKVVKDWVDVSNSKEYEYVLRAIDSMSASGGTNLDSGLRRSDYQFSKSPITGMSLSADCKNVVLLSDGKPTYYLKNHTGNGRADETIGDVRYDVYGNGANTTDNEKNGAKNAADTLKGNQKKATLYTVSFSDDTDLAGFLSGSIATSSSHAYSAKNDSELQTAFETIAEVIVSGLNAGTVGDLLPAGVTTTSTDFDEGVMSWELDPTDATDKSTDGDTTTYTYTKTYTVTIDPDTDTDNDGYVPLNGKTTFTYTDAAGTQQTANFPIPAGKVTPNVKYTLIYENDLVESDTSVTENDHPAGTVTLKGIGTTDGLINFSAPAAGDGHVQVVFIGWSTETQTKILGKGDEKPTLVGKVDLGESNPSQTVHAVWGYDDNRTTKPDIYEVTATYVIDGGYWIGTDDANKTENVALYKLDEDTSSATYGTWIEIDPANTLQYVPGTTGVVAKENHKTDGASWGASTPVNDVTTISEDTTFTYTLPEADKYNYSLIYDGNAADATNVPATQSENNTFATSHEFTVTNAKPSRTGYTFAGWYLNEAGTGTQYLGEAKITLPLDGAYSVALYAQWQKNNYTVTYMNGEIQMRQDTVAFGNSLPAAPNTSKTNYTFNGWYTDAAFTNAWDRPDTMPANDITVYGKWIENDKNVYTLTYNANAGSETVDNVPTNGSAQTHETSYTFTVDTTTTPAREGYEFLGWANDASASAADYSSTNNTVTVTKESPSKVVYAVWERLLPELSVTKTVTSIGGTPVTSQSGLKAEVGDEIVWTITVTNSGNADGKFILTDTLTGATGTAIVTTTALKDKDNYYTVLAKSGETNGTVVFTATYTVVEYDNNKTLKNTVKVTPESGDPTEGGSGDIKVDSNSNLSVAKTVYKVGNTVVGNQQSIPTAQAGDTVIWKIVVTNSGKVSGDFTLTDILGKTPITTFYSDPDCEQTTTNFAVGTGDNNTATYYVKYDVTADDVIGSTLVNKVTLKEAGKADEDSTAPGVPVGGLTVKKIVGTEIEFEPSIDESVPDQRAAAVTPAYTAKVGETITWTITVTNYFDSQQTFTLEDKLCDGSGEPITGAAVQITLPEGVTRNEDGSYNIPAATHSKNENNVIVIAPKTVAFTTTYEVQASDEGKTLVNNVKVTPTDGTPIEDDAPGVEVEGKLSVDKTVYSIKRGDKYIYGEDSGANAIPTAKVGDDIIWKIKVTNTNSANAYFKLEDILGTTGLPIYGSKLVGTELVPNGFDEENKIIGTYMILGEEGVTNIVSFFVKYTVKPSDLGSTLVNTVVMKDANDGKIDDDTAPGIKVEDKPNTPSYNPNYNAGVQLEKGEHFNYVIGYSDGTVRPEGNITRAEVATIFFRLLTDESRKTYLTEYNTFTDVEKSMWHNVAISTLARAGVLNGYNDGSFRPDNNITRAEMAAIISRFAELEGSTRISFTDIKGHWAEKSILLAASNGWINGYNDGSFRPDQNITRAETFAMINRVLERKVEHVNDLVSDMNTWVDNMDTTQWYYFDVQEATNYHSYQRKYTNTNAEKWIKKLTDIDWTVYQY